MLLVGGDAGALAAYDAYSAVAAARRLAQESEHQHQGGSSMVGHGHGNTTDRGRAG